MMKGYFGNLEKFWGCRYLEV